MATCTWPVKSTMFQGRLRSVLILVSLFKSVFGVRDSSVRRKILLVTSSVE